MVDRALIESLLVVKNDPRLQPFKDWLAAERAAVFEYMTRSNEDRALSVAQGDVRRINKILEFIDGASSLVEKGAR